MSDHRPIKTKCWEKFLKSCGCTFKKMKGTSHAKWTCPGCIWSIVFRPKDKEVPFAHIKTNLETMGIDKDDFFAWLQENC